MVRAKTKKTSASKTKKATTKKTKTSSIGLSSMVSAGKSIISSVSTKKTAGQKHKMTAKMLLKRAYERRAKREIRIGNLGKARRTLRKKTTVI